MSTYKSKPALVISADEYDELLAPWVFEIAGKQHALQSINSLSLDDLEGVMSAADDDVRDGLCKVAADEESSAFVAGLGIGVLRKVFEAWMKAQDVGLGESDSSEK